MQPFTLAQRSTTCQGVSFNLNLRLKIGLIGLIGLFGLISPFGVDAAAKKSAPRPRLVARAEKIIQSDSRLVMIPGEIRTVKVGFKNTSTNIVWRRDSKNYASLYTVGPRYRKSAFADKSWISGQHVTRVTQKQVKLGEIGYFEFKVHAPDALGDYTEDFGVALENLAWVDDAIFELRISVVPKNQARIEIYKNSKNLASPHEALLLLTSHKSLQMKTKENVIVRLGFKNSGKTAWDTRGLKSLSATQVAPSNTLAAATNELGDAPAWFDSEVPVYIKDQSVKPGEIGFLDLAVRAPQKAGYYILRLALVVDDQIVNGGEFELPVEVIQEADILPPPIAEFAPLIEEPTIRIGLEKTRNPILITADQTYEIRDGQGNPLGIVPAGVVSIVRFDFKHEVYSVETGTISYSGPNYLRFLPTTPDATFEIKSMTRNPYFSHEINDNKFRGGLEIRLSEVDNLWVINELKIEDYLRGLAETRDSAPLEFHKAQATAARSFAYYNIANGGKYKKGYFDLTWTASDQVYRGQVSETRMPNLVRGAIETRGVFVMYDGKVVTTPYFAQSNGRTRAWSQVWGGKDKPWLQPVPAPADEGKRQRGHGVGMSQIDAIWRAEQGANYEEILKYYYRGVEVKKLY